MMDYTYSVVQYSVVQCRTGSTVQWTVEPGLGQSAEPKIRVFKMVSSQDSRATSQVYSLQPCQQQKREHQIRLDWNGGKGRVEAPEGIKFVAGGDLSEGTGGHLDNR